MNASRVAKISQNNTLEDEGEQHGAVQQLHAPHGGQQSHLEAGGVGGALGGGAAGTRGRGTLVTLGTGSRSGWRHYDLACSPWSPSLVSGHCSAHGALCGKVGNCVMVVTRLTPQRGCRCGAGCPVPPCRAATGRVFLWPAIIQFKPRHIRILSKYYLCRYNGNYYQFLQTRSGGTGSEMLKCKYKDISIVQVFKY